MKIHLLSKISFCHKDELVALNDAKLASELRNGLFISKCCIVAIQLSSKRTIGMYIILPSNVYQQHLH